MEASRARIRALEEEVRQERAGEEAEAEERQEAAAAAEAARQREEREAQEAAETHAATLALVQAEHAKVQAGVAAARDSIAAHRGQVGVVPA